MCQVNSKVYPETNDEIFKHRTGIMRFMLERPLWKPGKRRIKGGHEGREVSDTALTEHLLGPVISSGLLIKN